MELVLVVFIVIGLFVGVFFEGFEDIVEGGIRLIGVVFVFELFEFMDCLGLRCFEF